MEATVEQLQERTDALESTIGEKDAEIAALTEERDELRTEAETARQEAARARARETVDAALSTDEAKDLPEAARERIRTEFADAEGGEEFVAQVKARIDEERAYIAALTEKPAPAKPAGHGSTREDMAAKEKDAIDRRVKSGAKYLRRMDPSLSQEDAEAAARSTL